MPPYWQDNIHIEKTWDKIKNIPNEELWKAHYDRKVKLFKLVRENTIARLRRNGMRYEEIMEIVSKLNPNNLTIGFARRFATYKRGTLIFRDLERITEILNNSRNTSTNNICRKSTPKRHRRKRTNKANTRNINEATIQRKNILARRL